MYGRALILPVNSTAALTSSAAPPLLFRDRAAPASVKAGFLHRVIHFGRRSDAFRCQAASKYSPLTPPQHPDASPDAVAEWARATFLSAVTETDDRINLAKVGLLISLEEEAAARAHRAANDQTALLPDLFVLRSQLAR